MSRLRRWHDNIKMMPADRYFGGLSVYCCAITALLAVAYVATGDNIYFWAGMVAIGLTVLCLDLSARARRKSQGNTAHDRDIRGGQHDRL